MTLHVYPTEVIRRHERSGIHLLKGSERLDRFIIPFREARSDPR